MVEAEQKVWVARRTNFLLGRLPSSGFRTRMLAHRPRVKSRVRFGAGTGTVKWRELKPLLPSSGFRTGMVLHKISELLVATTCVAGKACELLSVAKLASTPSLQPGLRPLQGALEKWSMPPRCLDVGPKVLSSHSRLEPHTTRRNK